MKSVYGHLRCVLLSVLFAIALVVSASAAFRDVPEDHWCAEPIAEMENRGFLAGYADGTFRPANPFSSLKQPKISNTFYIFKKI